MIRAATPDDYDAIKRIREEVALDAQKALSDETYAQTMSQQGFLLQSGLDEDTYRTEAATYSVFEHEALVSGYVCLRATRSLMLASKPPTAQWLKPEHKEPYYDDEVPHAYLYGIGVSRRVTHGGATGGASELLAHAEAIAKSRGAQWLFSMIVYAPILNGASLKFHEKHGFVKTALTAPEEEAGLANFQNLLLSKYLGSG